MRGAEKRACERGKCVCVSILNAPDGKIANGWVSFQVTGQLGRRLVSSLAACCVSAIGSCVSLLGVLCIVLTHTSSITSIAHCTSTYWRQNIPVAGDYTVRP